MLLLYDAQYPLPILSTAIPVCPLVLFRMTEGVDGPEGEEVERQVITCRVVRMKH